jgi:hypothetical protein
MMWLEEEEKGLTTNQSFHNLDKWTISAATAAFRPSSLYNYNLPLQLLSAESQMPAAAPWTTGYDNNNNELLSAFDAQPFQFVSLQQEQQGLDALLASKAESFFDDFEFPQDFTDEIESNDVFGNLLEQMIA